MKNYFRGMGRSPSAKEHEVLRADGVAKEMSKEATHEGTRSVTS